jgi:hypothetical protein
VVGERSVELHSIGAMKVRMIFTPLSIFKLIGQILAAAFLIPCPAVAAVVHDSSYSG